jgi:hypothetical protein
MSDKRQKNQLELAFMDESRSEAPRVSEEGTEALTAKRGTESPVIDEEDDSSTRRTAVCGPACTVVWEGRSREAPPYPDHKPRVEMPTNPGCPPNSHQPPVESAEICVIGGSALSRPGSGHAITQALRNKPTPPSKARRPFPAHHKITKRTHRPQSRRSRILDPPLPGPRQETRNTEQTHPARATPIRLNRSKVFTKHESRDTSDSRHKPGKYF